jgi:microcystin-dependent protein
MSEPFIGEIHMFAGNFAPRGWALCNGQLLSISQNTALFSILGTTYGGNGVTTFALPDLRGRVPMHAGQGPGLSDRILGEASGEESNTLSLAAMPQHIHQVNPACSAEDGDQSAAKNNFPASPLSTSGGAAVNAYTASPSPNTAMGGTNSAPVGGSQPHNNLQPYLVVNFIIALQGIFPSRN